MDRWGEREGARCRCLVAAVIAVVCLAVAAGAWAGGHHHRHHAKRVTCHVSGSLDGFFHVTHRGKVTGRRTDCRTARKVVKDYPSSCSKAYAAQAGCKIRASARWRCRNGIVGSFQDGAPSKVSCRHRRSRLKFHVAYFIPTEPRDFTPAGARAPFDDGEKCVDTGTAGTVLDPPNPSGFGNFQLHLLSGVKRSVGEDLQAALVSHKASPVLHGGLGSQPRNDPARIPVFLTRGKFDAGDDLGITAPTCEDRGIDAVIVRTDISAVQIAKVATHELFHAYAYWGINGGTVPVPWWEEASANWSVQKTGLPGPTETDIALQYPYEPLDGLENGHAYAMWRFVQFLDDRGLIGGDPAWPLQRQVIHGYDSPGATFALLQAIGKQNSGTSLGAELAAFWGDRLRAKPLHGPQLVPKPPTNATEIRVKPETKAYTQPAGSLRTALLDFKLADDVQRVEFEFDPPANGFFWGLTAPNDSRRFRGNDTVTFCVGGGSQDELEWPGHFPVTFTNGSLSTGQIDGKITVRASKDAGQCQPPTPDNRACHLLRDASVGSLLGAGSFPFSTHDSDSRHAVWTCFYTGSVGEANFNLRRSFKLTSKQVREGVKKQIQRLDLQRLDGVGDLAGIGTFDDGKKSYSLVVFAVAKENGLLIVGPGQQRQNATRLAKRLAGQLD